MTSACGSSAWPHTNRFVLYTDGRYRARVPAGRYRLIASKGIEYRVIDDNRGHRRRGDCAQVRAARTLREHAVSHNGTTGADSQRVSYAANWSHCTTQSHLRKEPVMKCTSCDVI